MKGIHKKNKSATDFKRGSGCLGIRRQDTGVSGYQEDRRRGIIFNLMPGYPDIDHLVI